LDKRIDAAAKDVQTAITQTSGLAIDPGFRGTERGASLP